MRFRPSTLRHVRVYVLIHFQEPFQIDAFSMKTHREPQEVVAEVEAETLINTVAESQRISKCEGIEMFAFSLERKRICVDGA